ncbi:hypothetical protein [Streptomyces mobaraensis]|uniref:Uncharacterized protein n=1 Tax=Streptomyces mobaraensis TaxID=35621 RepID=A0A5N5W2S1_STRMB|nr:hypothetical protein [Streptomyces mobaraensis]KAB7835548.1 hypothetical protein FRZ00_27045 [Streptomyces mobaraensis]
MIKNLRTLIGRSARISADDIDVHALYSLRMPNGDYAPGRILETHRLWERRLTDGIPYVSTETRPSRAEDRVVGFLAVADRTIDAGRPDHLEALRQVPQLVLADDPDEARRAVAPFAEEMSHHGEAKPLGSATFQPMTFMRQITVAAPCRIRKLPWHTTEKDCLR